MRHAALRTGCTGFTAGSRQIVEKSALRPLGRIKTAFCPKGRSELVREDGRSGDAFSESLAAPSRTSEASPGPLLRPAARIQGRRVRNVRNDSRDYRATLRVGMPFWTLCVRSLLRAIRHSPSGDCGSAPPGRGKQPPDARFPAAARRQTTSRAGCLWRIRSCRRRASATPAPTNRPHR